VPTSSKPDLITRYKLDSRLSEEIPPEPALPPTDKGKGKAPLNWSQSKEEREQNFKKRRDDMILRARKQMEQQAAAKPNQPS
jgi:coupling of ubiquitin conjugation to ER degradation protein 1